MQMDGIRGMHGWQWIFSKDYTMTFLRIVYWNTNNLPIVIEAIPTLVLACCTYFALPDFPETKSRCKSA